MKKILLFIAALAVFLQVSGCAGKTPPNTVFSKDNLAGSDIGVLKGSDGAAYAEGYGTLHTYESGEAMLVDLKNGILDCAVMDQTIAKATIKKVSGLKILSEPLVESDFCIAIAKENPELLEVVNAALKTLSDDGTLDNIIESYIPGTDYRYKTPEGTDLSSGTLTLAVDSAFMPYSYYDENGQTQGVDIDIARAICDIIHVDMKISVADRSNLVKMVQFGKADLALGGITNNEADAALVCFSDAYTQCTQVIITRR